MVALLRAFSVCMGAFYACTALQCDLRDPGWEKESCYVAGPTGNHAMSQELLTTIFLLQRLNSFRRVVIQVFTCSANSCKKSCHRGALKVLRMGITFFLLSNPQKLVPLIVTFASTNTPATFIPNQRERVREEGCM